MLRIRREFTFAYTNCNLNTLFFVYYTVYQIKIKYRAKTRPYIIHIKEQDRDKAGSAMKNKLLQGTIVLLCSSVVLRCIGFVYQMLVVRLAGTEALGILNMTMPFYMLLVVLATMGMPIAIAKLAAEYQSRNRQYAIVHMMRIAFLCVFGLSVLCLCIALVVMPQLFDVLKTDLRVRQCFRVLIPGIVIVPFCSVMRGYFQGLEQMVYPSAGQIAEQLIRVVCGIALLVWVSPNDVLSLAMSLAAAAMLGELGGCMFLGIFYWRNRKRISIPISFAGKRESLNCIKSLFSLGLPVTGTRITSTIDMAIEASLVPICLIAVGYTSGQAASIYGLFSGVAVSLLTIPTVLTGALSTALIPAISGAASAHRTDVLQRYCQQAISVTWIFCLPVIFILYLYGEEFGRILFHIEGLGEMMHWLSFGAVFLYLGQTVVGILQGLGMTRTVFFNNFCGSAAKLIGMYYCIASLGMGGNGIAGGMILGYGLQCMMNVAALGQNVAIRIPWKEIGLPLVNSLLMVVHLQFWENILPNDTIWTFFLRLVFAACGYLCVLVCTGVWKPQMKR